MNTHQSIARSMGNDAASAVCVVKGISLTAPNLFGFRVIAQTV
jgi:hypothetical protein